ncbi:P pilus assembly chaperone PapD [Pseudomonas sp. BIGb0408]|uniref:P pilus assembly chaperone PapD n=1 Tax=Phytopseudomonas flavescens TaxID=29435 RepID=A0A7Z0BLT9_9GAMM|nr:MULTISPECIES: molecular chaperone [Pseudomonas]MCW2293664.1 P pilus assembly chaperone PapD [Pseudomonas sp. BIGb0408]NYH71767.1 P pilus assembly chaperone PapD [Pseudomonas flavescens]
MKRLLLAALLTLPSLAHAGADINIGAMYDYLDGSKSTLLKRVRNSGDASAFVRVSVAELIYDASGKAREVPVSIANGSSVETRVLVASPARLIVPAGGMQAMRILYTGERDKERYFRLRFEPVLPQQDDGFGLSQAESDQYRESLSAGVNILAGYGSLLFVRPQHPRYATQIERHAERFLVRNDGNSSVVLDNFNDCSSDGKQCEVPSKYHVLPNSVRTFERKAGRLYYFDLIEGDKTQKIELKP